MGPSCGENRTYKSMMPGCGRESGKLFSVGILVCQPARAVVLIVPLSLQTLSCFSSEKVFQAVVKPNSVMIKTLFWWQICLVW